MTQGQTALKVVLLEWPDFAPWDIEAEAVDATGGELTIRRYQDFVARPEPADIVLNAGAWPLTPLLGAVDGLRCAVGYGVGLDWVDMEQATACGVMIVRMPLANVEEVATHALALVLACARQLGELDRNVRDGRFDRSIARPLRRLRGQQLGLLAFGNIARRLAALVEPLGMVVVAHDPGVTAASMSEHGVRWVSADELLATSSIVSVHLPSSPDTVRYLDRRRLDLLPVGAILVITSRGDIYDLDALVECLQTGRIGAAGLDVYPNEPLPRGHPITALPNVVLTPHVAGTSLESIEDQHHAAAEAVLAVSRGDRPIHAVGR